MRRVVILATACAALVALVLATPALGAPPVADDDAYDAVQFVQSFIPAPGVLDGDEDPEGGPLTAELVSGAPGLVFFEPDGSFSVEPQTSDTVTFSYVARDEEGLESAATVTVDVRPNARPVAIIDSFATPQDTPLPLSAAQLLGTDSDPDGDGLSLVGYSNASHGTVAFDFLSGQGLYSPDPGFVGTDSFIYFIEDDNGAGASAQVRIAVGAIDTTAPTVTIERATGQDDPATGSPILFDVEFSEPVEDFATDDVLLAGTAGATDAAVNPVGAGGTDYSVAASGMTGPGTVIASVPAGAARDEAGNPSEASPADAVVAYAPTPPDTIRPTVTVEQDVGQPDPTNALPIAFLVRWSEPILGFGGPGDIVLSGTAGAFGATVEPTGDPLVQRVLVPTTASNGTVTVRVPAGAVTDPAGNPNEASTSADDTVTLDRARPTVTITPQGSAPFAFTAGPIRYDVRFTEPVTGFAGDDVAFRGHAAVGVAVSTVVPVPGDASRYTVEATGMSRDGQLIADVRDRAARDDLGNESVASPNSGNIAVWDAAGAPTVTVEAFTPDPTNAATFGYRLTFSEPATRLFRPGDVIVEGTACAAGGCRAQQLGGQGAESIGIDQRPGGPAITDGTVVVNYAPGAATDAAGNGSRPSTSLDNVITYDATPPTVTVEQASDQVDPTGVREIAWEVLFSEDVTLVDRFDVRFTPSSAFELSATTPTLTGSGRAYRVTGRIRPEIAGATVSATLIAAAGRDAAGNSSVAPTSTDNSVTFQPNARPGVSIRQAQDQADPTDQRRVVFDIEFSEPVTGFGGGGVEITGTGGATAAVVAPVAGSPLRYTATVTDVPRDGTVTAAIPENAVTDLEGFGNTASTTTDDTVTFTGQLKVAVEQAAPDDPTAAEEIGFAVTFSRPPTGFAADDVVLGGSAGATQAIVSGTGTDRLVTVRGMTGDGTVTASIPAGAVVDPDGYESLASTSVDNEVTYAGSPRVTIDLVEPGDTTSAPIIPFSVVFSKDVAGFASDDVELSGTAGATTATVTPESAARYRVDVSGMTATGTVVASIPAGAATGLSGDRSLASTSVDNEVTYTPAPTSEVSVADAPPVVEGDTGTKTMRFTLTRTGSLAAAATIRWHTEDGTATAGEDYTARLDRTVRFAAGTATVNVTVPILGDRVGEEDETLRVLLDGSTGAPIGDGEGVGTIEDNDPPSLSIADDSVAEGNRNTKPMRFTVRLSRRWDQAVTVGWATADDTAAAGGDYGGGSGTATIPAGSRTARIDVTVNGDRTVEPDESFRIVLSAPTQATIADGEATGTIRNDD